MVKKNGLKWVSVILSLLLAVNVWVPTYSAFAADSDADTDEESRVVTNTVVDDGSEVSVPMGKLVAYWNFDGNYNESASNMKTELGGNQLTYTQGIFGKAAVFNGKDNYLFVKNAILNLGNSRKNNNDDFTISAWVNLGDSKTGAKYILDKGKNINWEKEDGCNWINPYSVLIQGSEPVVDLNNTFEDSNNNISTEGNTSLSGKYVDGNEWFLLTVTYDGDRLKIYHNNTLLNQTNYTEGISFNNDELYIGCNGNLESFFKGTIDDLRIYTKTFSYDEVKELYDKGVAANKELVEPTKKLVAYYPFDNNLKDNSTFKNDATKVAAKGKISYGVGMNGNAVLMSKGSYINVPAADQLNLKDEFTVSFWLKSTKDANQPILYRQNPSYTDGDDDDWTYCFYISTWANGTQANLNVSTRMYNPDSWTPEMGQGLSYDYNYAEDKHMSTDWNHYAYTYKDGQMNCYVNGELCTKTEKANLVDISNASGALLIGFDGTNFLTGALDELKIFTKGLTANEIAKESKRVDKISLSKTDTAKFSNLGKGKSITLTSVLLFDGDTNKSSNLQVTNKNLTYKSSNSKIFKVSASGEITAVAAGKAKLTVMYGPLKVVYNVVVK